MANPTLTFVPFDFGDDHYARLVALLNAAHPEHPRDEAELRHLDAGREPGEVLDRVLLVEGDRVLGAAGFETDRNDPQAGRYRLSLTVHPDALGTGAGDRLFDHVLGLGAAHAPRVLLAGAREDRWELAFLRGRGFREVDRMFASALDLAAFDPAPLAGFAERARAAGVEIRPLSAMPLRDPAFRRRWYETTVELLADVPMNPPVKPWPFEVWERRHADSPELVHDGYFFALHGEELVGTSQLRASGLPETIQTGLTGVRRAWRRRGIAQALKLAAAEYARAQGYRFVRTTNHSVNRPMLAINEAMGFVKEPAWVNLERPTEREVG